MSTIRDLIVGIDFENVDVDALLDIDDAMDEIESNFKTMHDDISDTGKEFDKLGGAGEDAMNEIVTNAEDATDSVDDVKSGAENAEDAVSSLGDTGDDAMEEVQRGADDATESLKGTEDAADKVGKSFSENIISLGDKFGSVGKKLTLGITTPVLGLVSAAGGLTAALGWKRLVGLDTAQAQLKGLGYNVEEVARISDQVTTALEGGMTTMAEGTAIAAGALAAGVDEGKDLERYIKLVGDAAIGANRPVDDMAQIFNRVQGSGKLMTNELNSIEAGMPGFASAMSESLGVAPEKFREMVTDGKVSSDQFLDVMEDFAGGMAGAYAESWEGMTKNTLAYIGIIGESILGGVFEDGKETLAGFIELLKSDAVLQWAEDMGGKVGDALSMVSDKIKSMKNWFDELSPSAQSMITKMAIFGTVIATALGPALMIFGKVFGVVGKVIGIVNKVRGVVQGAGGAFALLSNPIGLTVAAIGLLIGGFILAYNKVEWFRDAVHDAWDWIKEATTDAFGWVRSIIETVISAVSEFVGEKLEVIREFWSENGEALMEIAHAVFSFIQEEIINRLTLIQSFIEIIWSVITSIISVAWEMIQIVISTAIDFVIGIIEAGMLILQGDWEGAWEKLKETASSAIDGLIELFGTFISGALQIGKDFVQGIIDGFLAVWDSLVTTAENIWSSVTSIFSRKQTMSVDVETSGSGVDGSHFAGLDRVPFDGYIAELHKDEAVLTAQQADALRQTGVLDDGKPKPPPKPEPSGGGGDDRDPGGGSRSGGGGAIFAPQITVEVTNNGGGKESTDPDEIARAVRKEMNKFWQKMNLTE